MTKNKTSQEAAAKGRVERPLQHDVSWPKIGQEVEDIHHGKIGTVVDTYKENNADYARVDWGLYEKDVSTRSLKEVDS